MLGRLTMVLSISHKGRWSRVISAFGRNLEPRSSIDFQRRRRFDIFTLRRVTALKAGTRRFQSWYFWNSQGWHHRWEHFLTCFIDSKAPIPG